MKKFYLCKLCLIVFGALLAVQSVSAGNWNQPENTAKSLGRFIKYETTDSGVTKYFGYSQLPPYLDPPPNDKTISFYYQKWINETGWSVYQVDPSPSPKDLKFKTSTNRFLTDHLQASGVLSYLYFEDGNVIYDELAPNARFDFELNDSTELRSNSVGKSIVSYLIGHAICEGYISSVDQELSDWSVLDNTLYSKLKLIDLLNMRARDQHVVTEEDGFLISRRWFNKPSIANAATNELKGTKPNDVNQYNYNGFVTNVIMSYMIYKLDNWQAFLDRVFQKKIGVQNRFIFRKLNGIKEEDGLGLYSAYATRYDYLRIALAIMTDWQSNNCVGNYLRQIYERRQPKSPNEVYVRGESPEQNPQRRGIWSRTYGGQFHFDYIGMEKRPILGMDGYGGQSILIDPQNSRIVVVNTAHTNYDWNELVYQPILNGKLRK